MNIVNKLTVRQLRLNKKRTMVTIIGVIISTAMITAVSTLGISFMDLMRRQEIADNGAWHVSYQEVPRQSIEKIRKDKQTETVILTNDLGYAYLAGGKNENKPYLFIREMNQQGFENKPITLAEGRLPQAPDELVISDAILANGKVNYHIGDQISMEIGHRYPTTGEGEAKPLGQASSLSKDQDKVSEYLTKEIHKTYTVVGIMKRPTWEYTWSPGYTVLSYLDETTLTDQGTADVSVLWKQVKQSMFSHATKLGHDNNIPDQKIMFNNSLLRYYGVVKDDSVRRMLISLTVIIMGIIVIGSVSLIYNAFAISVAERSRYLGMLSSIGATRKQKKNSVFFEGYLIAALSIPFGVLAGLIGMEITFLCINPMMQNALGATEKLSLVIEPVSILTAIAISMSTIMVSTFLPAKRASKITAIEALRQSGDVKITGRAVKTSKLTRRIFGMEGDLGLKNLKRNRRRYQATVFSLIISMILFLVVTYFTMCIRKSVVLTQDGINYDISVTVRSQGDEEYDAIAKKIRELDNITKITEVFSFDTTTSIPKAQAADYIVKNNIPDEKGMFPYQVTVNVLDDATLKTFAGRIGVDEEKLKDTNQPSAIVIDTAQFKDSSRGKYVEAKAVKVRSGDELNLNAYRAEEEKYEPMLPITIAATTDQRPMGVMSYINYEGFHIIISRACYEKLVGESDGPTQNMSRHLYLNGDQPLVLQQNIEEMQGKLSGGSVGVYNLYLYRQREHQMWMLLSVFTYAFLFLITSISVANILNTISTGVALRKREFAMLKSVGITPKSFNKMLNYESIFYGIKALVYGIPISFFVMYLIYGSMLSEFDFPFFIPWGNVFLAVGAVFIIVIVAMLYSSRKVKNENIIDALKQEIN